MLAQSKVTACVVQAHRQNEDDCSHRIHEFRREDARRREKDPLQECEYTLAAVVAQTNLPSDKIQEYAFVRWL